MTQQLIPIALNQYNRYLQASGRQPRIGQRQMIQTISATLGALDTRIAVIEAGTGTGKSLAYLCAAAPIAKRLGKKLVVSTGTIQLQQQLVEQDLPDFLASTGLQLTVELAKGRGRYVCLSKLEKLSREGEEGIWQELRAQFDAGTWNGEQDSIPVRPDWHKVACNRHDCPGNACPNAHRCVFLNARNRLELADIIVSNHDLTLNDLAMDGALLSKPEDTIYVFDEGHHLPDKALKQFSFQWRLDHFADWASSCADFIEACQTLAPDLQDALTLLSPLYDQLQPLQDLIQELAESLAALPYVKKENDGRSHLYYRFERGILPAEILQPALRAKQSFKDAYQRLDAAVSTLKKAALSREGDILRLLELGSIALALAEPPFKLLTGFAHQERAGEVPRARWVISDRSGSFILHCGAINASKALNHYLFSKAYGVVIASATLTFDQSFDSFTRECGIPSGAVYQRIASPFDYPRVGTLRIPRKVAPPQDRLNHTRAIADYLANNLDLNEGSLVVFTSKRQMQEVYEMLPDHMHDFILLQGNLGKTAILAAHRERIDSGCGSCIFGLNATFGEGADLPGRYVTNVIVSKIDFHVPDDPIVEAKQEYIQAQGGHPFMEMTLPEASRKLVQTVGRLIRTEHDRGSVTIMDSRLLHKSYGKLMLSNLPPLRLINE